MQSSPLHLQGFQSKGAIRVSTGNLFVFLASTTKFNQHLVCVWSSSPSWVLGLQRIHERWPRAQTIAMKLSCSCRLLVSAVVRAHAHLRSRLGIRLEERGSQGVSNGIHGNGRVCRHEVRCASSRLIASHPLVDLRSPKLQLPRDHTGSNNAESAGLTSRLLETGDYENAVRVLVVRATLVKFVFGERSSRLAHAHLTISKAYWELRALAPQALQHAKTALTIWKLVMLARTQLLLSLK